MAKRFSSNTLHDEEIDKLLCLYGKKYHIKKLLLKAVMIIESSGDERAYRFEPQFWTRYLKNNPEWKDKNPAEVSASFGLFQLMYTTAHGLGFRGTGEDLYNPAINIELGAKLVRNLLDKVRDKHSYLNTNLWDIEIALAWYNGGSKNNPSPEGKLRNQRYVTRVLEKYQELRKKESECDET